ncbi:unnamed protein product [Ilex paraguariensis]|uniref:RNase H type-1 domain-containing protein n=1 Tax=Ilex paraguariensis TaxID=185542 RepID=A0ABC8R8H1_9AQUA
MLHDTMPFCLWFYYCARPFSLVLLCKINHSLLCFRFITHLQLRDLMVPLIFGTKIASKDSRLCRDAINLYLAVPSTTTAQYLHIRFVMIGVRVQKITIHQPQRHIFSYTYHRRLRLKANRELEQVAESELLVIMSKERVCAVLYMEGKIKVPWRLRELTNQIPRRLSALSCTLVHTYREGNMVADYLVRKGVADKTEFRTASSNSIPAQARTLILQDQSQLRSLRQKKSWVYLNPGGQEC